MSMLRETSLPWEGLERGHLDGKVQSTLDRASANVEQKSVLLPAHAARITSSHYTQPTWKLWKMMIREEANRAGRICHSSPLSRSYGDWQDIRRYFRQMSRGTGFLPCLNIQSSIKFQNLMKSGVALTKSIFCNKPT